MLSEQVIPAYRKLQKFVVDTYIPGSRETLGMSDLPDGAAWYRHRIQVMTTTDRSADEIHTLGIQEVGRIEAEMDALRKQAGFTGDRKAFFVFLTTDPRFFYTDKDALIAGYRDIAKRIDPELPKKRFRTLPRLTYGVLPVPAYSEKTQTTAYYDPGAPEVGRAGIFFANTYDLGARPKWAMEDLVLHEAVPGHHFAVCSRPGAERAAEVSPLRRVQRLRRGVGGCTPRPWGKSSACIRTPIPSSDRRAVRSGAPFAWWWIPVSTPRAGPRQQAIEYLNTHSGKAQHDIEVEVDRYIVWPGQALGYKIGQLTIKDLRQQAAHELGDRFDERDFHDQVLGAGAAAPVHPAGAHPRVGGGAEAHSRPARGALKDEARARTFWSRRASSRRPRSSNGAL